MNLGKAAGFKEERCWTGAWKVQRQGQTHRSTVSGSLAISINPRRGVSDGCDRPSHCCSLRNEEFDEYWRPLKREKRQAGKSQEEPRGSLHHWNPQGCLRLDWMGTAPTRRPTDGGSGAHHRHIGIGGFSEILPARLRRSFPPDL